MYLMEKTHQLPISVMIKERRLFLHDSRDCPETAVSLLHQKRLGSGSEPTNYHPEIPREPHA